MVLKDSDSVFKTLDILLLLPPTLFGGLSVNVTILEKEGLKKTNNIAYKLKGSAPVYEKNSIEHGIDKNHGSKEYKL